MKSPIPALLSIVVFGLLANTAEAAPVLIKRSSEVYGSGKVRTVHCEVSIDGVIITREYDGIVSTEEKSYKLAGAIDSKMDDVAATKAETKKITPSEFSYSSTAYRTSSAGGRDALVLSLYDGVKGEDTHNLSAGAGILRAVLNDACNK